MRFAQWLILIALLSGISRFSAAEKKPPPYESRGKAFLVAKFTGDKKALEDIYAEKVLLLPGHEYLKARYGINPSGDRSKPKMIAKDELIKLDAKLAERLSEKDCKELIEFLKKSRFTFTVAKGENTKMDPSDPAGTPDGKLTLPTQEGDVIMKIQPKPKGDYLLYVLRKDKDRWKVVADYTD